MVNLLFVFILFFLSCFSTGQNIEAVFRFVQYYLFMLSYQFFQLDFSFYNKTIYFKNKVIQANNLYIKSLRH